MIQRRRGAGVDRRERRLEVGDAGRATRSEGRLDRLEERLGLLPDGGWFGVPGG